MLLFAIDEEAAETLDHEHKIMMQLNSPRILKPVFITRLNGVVRLIMPRFQSDLRKYFTSTSVQINNEIMLLRRTACGLAYLHEQKCYHGDIKLDNVLVNSDYDAVVISDFGLSIMPLEQNEMMEDVFGTPMYYSPEMNIRNPRFGFPADVFAFGHLMFETFNDGCDYMFEDVDDETFHLTQLDPRVVDNKISSLNTTKIVKKAIRRCFKFYPTKRADSQKVVAILNETEEIRHRIVKTQRSGLLFELPKRTKERMKQRTLLEYLMSIQKWPESVGNMEALSQLDDKCLL